MIKKTVILIFGGLLSARLAVATPPPDLGSADWSISAPHNFAKDPPSSEAVWNFMTHFWGDSWIEEGKLCSFRFVDLGHPGGLSLVAIYDWGGRFECEQLTIFDKGPAGFEGFDYGGPLLDDDLKDIVKDIDGNGDFELTIQSFDRTEGENTWPSVYAWTCNGYTNLSFQYPAYYRTWLASLKEQIAKREKEDQSLAGATPAPNVWVRPSSAAAPQSLNQTQSEQPEAAPSLPPDIELDKKRAEAAKIERFLGSKDAGMLDAIRWANSGDRGERTLAAQVFAEIATPETLRYEQRLGRDADPEVAKLASRKLKYWGEVDPYEAPSFARVTPEHPRAF